jgi:type IV pilus assembly protein PilM
MAAMHADIDNFVEQIHRTGLVLESLDVEPCGLFRAFERFIRRKEDEQEVQVLVDVGARRSQVIIARGRDISFYKTIDIGSSHLHEAVSRKLNISVDEAKGLRRRLMTAGEQEQPVKRDPVRQAVIDATRSIMEDLAREIGLCLRYYCVTFRGQRPSQARIVGGEGNDGRLVATLKQILNIPVEPGRPLFSVHREKMRAAEQQGTMSEWTLALGLGLKTTKCTFAPLDGKPRHDVIASPAQVVDLNAAVTEAGKAEVANA